MPDKKFIIKPGGYHHSVVIDKLEKWFPNVTVGGWYKSINEFYQQCKCILYPSLWEGFGMVPMEAASNGCLVFANDHPIIRDANPDFPVFIDAYTEEATDNWLTYFNKVPDMEKDSMYMSAAEDWKDEIIDILGDNKLIDKHISLGFDAMGKHKVREDTLWEAYLERLLILKEV
jgi:glycosyltransferase involved in cell wall biosynthesis